MCGCLNKNNSNTVVNSNRNIQSKNARVISTETNPNLEVLNCEITYENLRDTDLKAIAILRINKDSLVNDANKKLIFWIRNLKNECPNVDEFNILKDFIENEYTKYNT